MSDIMSTILAVKDECAKHEWCTECSFKDDETGVCLFMHAPEYYDTDMIAKALEITPLTSNSES
jgi:hypothetical protein